MDVSAQTTMKGAAKCDKHCELQNSANQWDFERILLFQVLLKERLLQCLLHPCLLLFCVGGVFVRQGARAVVMLPRLAALDA